jgi:hypothetical protein
VEFEDGPSTSVLKNRATRDKNLQLGIVKFLKKSCRRTEFYTPPFQTFVCVAIGQDLPQIPIFSEGFEHSQKSKVMEMVSSRFY